MKSAMLFGVSSDEDDSANPIAIPQHYAGENHEIDVHKYADVSLDERQPADQSIVGDVSSEEYHDSIPDDEDNDGTDEHEDEDEDGSEAFGDSDDDRLTEEFVSDSGESIVESQRATVKRQLSPDGSIADEMHGGARYWTDPMAGKVCFVCGKRGHLRSECTQPTPCYLCGSLDHQSNQCVVGVCFNCFRPGHQKLECPRPTASFYCKRCDLDGHSEGECPDIWCEYVWGQDKRPQPVQLRQFCYSCGLEGHFGDDCESRGLARGVSRFSTTAFKSDESLLAMGYRGIAVPPQYFSYHKRSRNYGNGSISRDDRDVDRREKRPRQDDRRYNSTNAARQQPHQHHYANDSGDAAHRGFVAQHNQQLPFYAAPIAPPMMLMPVYYNGNYASNSTSFNDANYYNNSNNYNNNNGPDQQRLNSQHPQQNSRHQDRRHQRGVGQFTPRYRGGYSNERSNNNRKR